MGYLLIVVMGVGGVGVVAGGAVEEGVAVVAGGVDDAMLGRVVPTGGHTGQTGQVVGGTCKTSTEPLRACHLQEMSPGKELSSQQGGAWDGLFHTRKHIRPGLLASQCTGDLDIIPQFDNQIHRSESNASAKMGAAKLQQTAGGITRVDAGKADVSGGTETGGPAQQRGLLLLS